jgi:FAD/FMN-containing dehydrogenase
MINPHALTEALKRSVRSDAVYPADDAYDSLRKVFNTMIDKRPAVIVRCQSAADVAAAVDAARTHDLEAAVRGGGHSVAGKSVCEGGILIDLSAMKRLWVDPVRGVARAEPGLRLGELDRGTAAYGLATPMGIVSNTGIAGLTLGGGIGWLNGRYGLACDNVLSAEVVTADGRRLTASRTENEDLLWGLQGGGGNFGIVTQFEYRLHAVDAVLGGMVLFAFDRAKEVLPFVDEFAQSCPDELSMLAALLNGPDGEPAVAIAVCFCGDVRQRDDVIRPLRQLSHPIADMIRPMRFPDLQCLLDDAFPPGRFHYWKSNFIRRLSSQVIELLLDYFAAKPSPLTIVALQQVHGAASRVDPAATAFPHRGVQFDLGILSQWSDPANTESNVRWAQNLWSALQPYVERGVYVNNLGEEGDDRVRAAYGNNYERLVALKRKYDPNNFFRLNQNIIPTPAC